MRSKRPFTWIALVLGMLLISTVLSQSGAYVIRSWSISGGGSSTSDTYTVEDSFAQPVVDYSTGGSYTLQAGFWDSDVADNRAIYLAQIGRPRTPTPLPTATPTPTPTPTTDIPPENCGEDEPNEGIKNANKYPTLGKPCIGSFDNKANDRDDWYFVTLAAGTVVVNLTNIPANNDYDIYLYNATDEANAIASSDKDGAQSESITLPIEAGLYHVRVYARAKQAPSNTYVLRVSQ
jgi:hypothetical protein